MLFSTRFSTTFSTTFSTIFKNIKKLIYQHRSQQLLTTKFFLHKTPYTSPSFQIKIRVLRCRCFQNLPLFTTFLLLFIVDEVCDISSKYQPPNNLAKHQYFYTRGFLLLFHFQNKLALSLHPKSFRKHALFTTFSQFLKVSEVCDISSRY